MGQYLLLINRTRVQIFDAEISSGISQLYYGDNAFSTCQEWFVVFFFYPPGNQGHILELGLTLVCTHICSPILLWIELCSH